MQVPDIRPKKQPPDAKMVGYTVFPDDPLPVDYIYSFASNETLAEVTGKQHGFILPVVMGCIDYFFAFGESIHHQSKFVYELSAVGPSGVRLAIIPSEGDKPLNLLRLDSWFEAGSFQAD